MFEVSCGDVRRQNVISPGSVFFFFFVCLMTLQWCFDNQWNPTLNSPWRLLVNPTWIQAVVSFTRSSLLTEEAVRFAFTLSWIFPLRRRKKRCSSCCVFDLSRHPLRSSRWTLCTYCIRYRRGNMHDWTVRTTKQRLLELCRFHLCNIAPPQSLNRCMYDFLQSKSWLSDSPVSILYIATLVNDMRMYFLWQCLSYLPNYLSFGACGLFVSLSLSLSLFLCLSLSLSVSRLRNQTVAHFLFAFWSISLCSSVDSGAGWVLLGLAAMGTFVKVDWNLLKLSDTISSHVQKLNHGVFFLSCQRLDWGRCRPCFFVCLFFDFWRLCNVWSSCSFALYLWLPCF